MSRTYRRAASGTITTGYCAITAGSTACSFRSSSIRVPRKVGARSPGFTPMLVGRFAALHRAGTAASSITVFIP